MNYKNDRDDKIFLKYIVTHKIKTEYCHCGGIFKGCLIGEKYSYECVNGHKAELTRDELRQEHNNFVGKVEIILNKFPQWNFKNHSNDFGEPVFNYYSSGTRGNVNINVHFSSISSNIQVDLIWPNRPNPNQSVTRLTIEGLEKVIGNINKEFEFLSN